VSRSTWRRALAALVSLAVVVVLVVLAPPSSGLFAGFAVSAAFALLAHTEIPVPRAINRVAQAILGTTVATLVDVDEWVGVRAQLPAVVGVATLTIVVAVGTGQVLRRRGASATTAVLASVPGGASTVTAIAEDLGADQRVVVVVQYLRVVVVIVTLPVLLSGVFHVEASGGVSRSGAGAVGWIFVLIAVPGGLALGRLLRLPAPAVLGGLLAGTLLMVTPYFEQATTPPLVQTVALLTVGIHAGSGLTRGLLADLRGLLPAALLTTVVLVAFCAAVAVPFSAVTGVSALDAYLATSPGGLPVVLAASIDSDGDAALVSVTQVVRLLAVLLVTPLVLSIARRRRS
jgi:membrane AbrB-like protein